VLSPGPGTPADFKINAIIDAVRAVQWFFLFLFFLPGHVPPLTLFFVFCYASNIILKSKKNTNLNPRAQAGIPIFGVCLGLQAIVEHAGGSLSVLPAPVHGKPSLCTITEDGAAHTFAGISTVAADGEKRYAHGCFWLLFFRVFF
jgi:anthranilate/para-aminobenzoate synthase component II